MKIKQDHKGHVLLMALKIMLHAKLCLCVIIFLICMCWHPERMYLFVIVSYGHVLASGKDVQGTV
jgi:hypothetical protein